MNRLLFFICFSTVGINAIAQRDTTKQQSVDIISGYRPVLRNAVKINFSGSQLPADTSTPVLQYKIPAQNLFYAYAPPTLKPLALAHDTSLALGNRNFLKAGFGNLSTPYVSAGISGGNGKQGLFNLTGEYIQSEGKIENQDYSLLDIKGNGSYFFAKNELYGKAGVTSNLYRLYGYDHSRFSYAKNDIQQQLQNVHITAGFKNTAVNDLGVNYNVCAGAGFFSNGRLVKETNALINLSADKYFKAKYGIKLLVSADLTDYTNTLIGRDIAIYNNLVQAFPSLTLNSDAVKFNGGITLAYNNNELDILPNIYAEAVLPGRAFAVQAGAVGRYIKNSYKNLTDINPYLAPVTFQKNTSQTEYYGGLKSTFADHFNVSVKVGLVQYRDLPFFINDTATDQKAFQISNESRVNNFRVHGDISYISRANFSFTGGVTINGYTGMRDNAKAWHTLPVEIRSSLRWYAFKSVQLKADFYGFAGSNYLAKGPSAVNLSGGTDLSAGAEFKINKRFSVWADVNNILNDKYERWHNYQVYGVNFLGGAIVRF